MPAEVYNNGLQVCHLIDALLLRLKLKPDDKVILASHLLRHWRSCKLSFRLFSTYDFHYQCFL